jgi:hypothetical protein
VTELATRVDTPEIRELVHLAATLPESVPENLSDGTPNPFRSKQMQALVTRLAGSSASRSDVLAAYLIFRGLGAEEIYKIVKEASEATITISAGGNKVTVLPDHNTRKWAAEFLAKTLGYLFVAKQDKVDVPNVLVQIHNEIKSKSTEELIREAKRSGITIDMDRFGRLRDIGTIGDLGSP